MTKIAAKAPIWLLGLSNLPFGLGGAVVLINVPQLLAARGVPQATIAGVTAFALIPSFLVFLFAPILDVRFSRKTYALIFGPLAGALCVAGLLSLGDPGRLAVLLFAALFSAALFNAALGGWLGSQVDKDDESKLASWFTIGNIGGFGIGAVLNMALMRGLPAPLGALAVGAVMTLPLIILTVMPEAFAGTAGARESFANMGRDLKALLRDKSVLRTIAMFALPTASFALTNSLGGLGNEFGASEQMVSIIAGVGVTVAGVFGSLAAPRLAGKMNPALFYLCIAAVGAAFTLSLLLMPRTPLVFAIALIGENVFQSAAFTAESTIIFRGIVNGSPLAATQYALLNAATALPITYMQMIDGQAYGAGGLRASLLVDAALSLLACAILYPLIRRWARNAANKPAIAS